MERSMQLTQSIKGRWLFMAILLTACSLVLTQPVAASELTHGDRDFNRHAYVATGLGLSHLNPDTSEVDEDVNDRVNAAGQITIGVDLHRWVSMELHSADLGSAGLFPTGRINYHVHGGSVLMYFGKNRGKHARNGLLAYGRTGLGYLQNSPVGSVKYQRENAFHLLFGAGVEYVSKVGLGARAEILSFDNDVFYSQLALTYRFGKKRRPIVLAEKAAPVIAVADPTPVVSPIPAVAVINPDKDADGVLNEIDLCPSTGAGVSVDSSGCALFDGVVEGVNFHTNSATLTSAAKKKLDDVVATLAQHANINATVSAHTDSWGDDDYNQVLSERRAQAVVNYLSRNGIQRTRLKAAAFGESQPIANNKTAQGRERNRRVEVVALESER